MAKVTMRPLRLYTGRLNDDIIDAIPVALEEAKRENETVYLQWNGVFVHVRPDSTVDECLAEYEEYHNKDSVWHRYKKGDLVSYEDLGKKIAVFIKRMNV